MNTPLSPSSSVPQVQRQIKLPLSKAVEIAYKSIRLRLSRSLLVTSAIVLALAFLMSILSSEAIIGSVRQWANSRQAAIGKVAHPSQDEKAELLALQQLQAKMQAKGVPVTAEDIHNDRIQTRWLLGLALLVAFVGILNAMLMSVTERFREIGTMKCLGALDGFIIRLFLLESMFQGFVGTTLGVAIGMALSLLAATFSYGGEAWRHLPVRELFLAILFCVSVGVVLTIAGALYPAWTAARMQPIAAMRVET